LTGLPHLWHTHVMRQVASLLISLCVGSLSQSLAAEPPQAPAVQAAPSTPGSSEATAAVSAAATTTAASSAKAETVKDGDAKAQALALDKKMRGQGYKPRVQKNGTTLYCRNEPDLGSHFERQFCGTPEDLERAALSAKEATESIQQASRAGSAK
jgi:hypothetical protein